MLKKLKNPSFDTIVAGHICIDITPVFNPDIKISKIDEILQPGKLINVGMPSVATGGPVSNTGLALIKFGIKTLLVAKVGDDGFGKLAIDYISKWTKDISGIKVSKGEGTSYTIVLVIPGLDRIFLHDPGANNTFSFSDINYEKIKNAKIFHLGYPPLMKKLYEDEGKELLKIYKKVKGAGLITSLDMSLPDPLSESGKVNWLKLLENVLPYVDIFVPSYEEILYMLDRESFENKKDINKVEINYIDKLGRISTELGAKIVMIKCSHRGIYLKTKNNLKEITSKLNIDIEKWSGRTLFCPSYKARKVVSATGSGDCAIAGFLTAILKKKNPEESLKCANMAGLHNLRAYDALSGLTGWDEIEKDIKDPSIGINYSDLNHPQWIFRDNINIFELKEK